MAFKRLFLAALLPMTLTASAQSYRIAYRWLNQPCSEVLNCDAGCSACNIPESAPGVFVGTNAAWIGVVTCPLPVTVADNAIYTAGWTADPTNEHAVIFSGIATVPVRIDSIRFRHAVYQDGPQRVKLMYTNDMAQPLVELADVPVPDQWQEAVVTGAGAVVAPEGNPFGMFQLRFHPYMNNSGGWALDELVIVATPLEGELTTIAEVLQGQQPVSGPLHDVLGRPVGQERAAGVYGGRSGRRIVQVD